MEPKLNFSDIISFAITNGLKNAFSITIAFILYILTVLIPYLNIGTFIALANMPIILSKGKLISPTFIFDSKYRRQMGDYFIYLGISSIGFFIAVPLTLGFGAVVLSFAWMLAPMLVLDKGMNPIEALSLSNKYMKGHKRTVFLSLIFLPIVLLVAVSIGRMMSVYLGLLLALVLFFTIIPIYYSALGYLYKVLVLEREEQAKASAQPIEIADELAKLNELFEKGTLSFEEFEIRKQKLMNL